ncbi:AfsA-related hotdog domain-containing protein [Phyllobacterium sp. TAF24]|uniref:AfsA-related hotdog domain-containing protein n=1 Tax=Phyllobacterium sp. TAF24 TaxID=3233068 RepID=UPI003F9E9E3D
MTIFMVVSDRFSEFSGACGALTFSEAYERLKNSDHAEFFLIEGQGLSENDRVSLETVAHLRGTTKSLTLWRDEGSPTQAHEAITHKRQQRNTLISVPVVADKDVYRSHLIISDQNEFLLDHVTGQQIQGMIIVEACRQMFIAVSELGHMDGVGSRKTYVVFNEFSARFLAFTFPLPAFVEYKLLNRNEMRPDRNVISAEISVWQNDVKTSEVHVNYTLFEPSLLKPKEIAKGIEAVKYHSQIVEKRIKTETIAE